MNGIERSAECAVRSAECVVRSAEWIVRRTAGTLLWVAVLVMQGVPALAQPPAPTLALEALETRALERHPSIAKAAAEVEAARGRAAQAGAWDNPSIGGGLSEWRSRETPSGTVGGFIEQTFNLGGKRSAERASAAAELAVREAALERARQQVRLGVRLAYYDLASAAEQRALAQRIATVADESVAIAKQLMNVGLADRPDLLAAEAEAARLRAQAESARVHEQTAWRRLAIAAGDPAMAAQPVAPLPEDGPPVIDRQAALDRILAQSPEWREAQATVERERSAVTVEQRRMFPDLTLRGEAGWNREHFSTRSRAKGWEFGAEAAVTLPLFNRNRGGVMAARAEVSVAETAAALVRLALESRFADAFEAYAQARLMADAYRQAVLPRLEEAMSLNQSRYSEMATPYPQVLESRQAYLEALADYTEAVAAAWQSAMQIEGLLAGGVR